MFTKSTYDIVKDKFDNYFHNLNDYKNGCGLTELKDYELSIDGLYCDFIGSQQSFSKWLETMDNDIDTFWDYFVREIYPDYPDMIYDELNARYVKSLPENREVWLLDGEPTVLELKDNTYYVDLNTGELLYPYYFDSDFVGLSDVPYDFAA